MGKFIANRDCASVPFKHLTGIDKLDAGSIAFLLDRADDYAHRAEKGESVSDTLRDKVVVTAFFEHSTRTRVSFEMAAHRLGARVINWDPGTSSLKKGESFLDTILTLNAMAPDALILRHSEYGAPEFVAQHMTCPVINAGDSWREHPTQALLDALTMRRAKGRLEGLNVAICGDIAHSRVANSNMILLSRMGANVRVVAPSFLVPEKFPVEGIAVFETLEAGLPGVDVVMILRNQKERMEAGLIKSDAEYFRLYGLTSERLALAKPDAVVMHPAPMNRGVEIADAVADDPVRSLIWEQMRLGVFVRMAVLDVLAGGEL